MSLRFMKNHEMNWTQLSEFMGSDDVPTFSEYLKTLDVPKEKVNFLIEGLAQCDCCHRHQKMCPRCLMQPSDLPRAPPSLQTPEDDKPMNNRSMCSCKCRQYSRLLCHTFG